MSTGLFYLFLAPCRYPGRSSYLYGIISATDGKNGLNAMTPDDNSCEIDPSPVQTFDIAMSLPDEIARTALQKDGVICLKNAHGPKWLSLIETGIDEALNGASQNLDIVKKAGDGGQFSFSSQAWRQVETFREAIFDSRAPDIAWQLLGCASINLFYDFLLIKEAHTNKAATPWHQDHAYYPLEGQGVINCWTALDTIPMETALRFWAGSHRQACLFQAANFAGDSDYQHVQSDHPVIPDIDNDCSAHILACELSPGDMLVWDSFTFHSAPGNSLGTRRAAFSINWAADTIRFRDIPSLKSYRSKDISHGDPITCEKFPQVRPSSKTT